MDLFAIVQQALFANWYSFVILAEYVNRRNIAIESNDKISVLYFCISTAIQKTISSNSVFLIAMALGYDAEAFVKRNVMVPFDHQVTFVIYKNVVVTAISVHSQYLLSDT